LPICQNQIQGLSRPYEGYISEGTGMEFLGGRVPLPSRLVGLGERRELPQWGPGQSPG